MTEHKEETQTKKPREEIDLLELVLKVWNRRWWIFKVCGVAAVIGLVVAFSLPKEYESTVVLAPEAKARGISGGMGALAAMAGVNLNASTGEDALSPELYPDIIHSTPFLTELFEVSIPFEGTEVSLYHYLLEEQKKPWWSAILGLPGKAISLLKGASTPADKTVTLQESEQITSYTLEENSVLHSLISRIKLTIDNKTGITTITAQMQDPEISARVVDAVTSNLQVYITDYRTNKARQDLIFTEQLFEEAQKDYFETQAAYARYMDQNQNVVLQRFRTEQERLQNEVNLKYGVYNQVAQQLQVAKVKVQEKTPVYSILQPAQVPLQASKPNKKLVLLGFVIGSFIICSLWILVGLSFLEELRKR